MFAVLIGQQIAAQAEATTQQQRAADLQSRLTEVDDLALRDPLTGLLNQRGIERWLATASANLRPGVEQVAIGFWDELGTSWVLLDCELLPWSAKAKELLREQYAAMGARRRGARPGSPHPAPARRHQR